MWSPTSGRAAIETTDLLIEEVHFSLTWCTWYDVGWKSMAVNVSDIAAMGGQPRAAFVSAGLKGSMKRDEVLQLYTGLADCAAEYAITILGGDTVAAPAACVVNVALYGESIDDSGVVLRRDAAQPGDALAVSGPLGASAAFIRLKAGELRQAQVHPRPRVALGQDLLRAGIRCAMDISDGLLADLGKLCAASSAGARLELASIPIAGAVQRLLSEEASAVAVTGGEDYELLASGRKDVLEAHGMIVIGEVTTDSGVQIIDEAGAQVTFPSAGYDAFRWTDSSLRPE